jgi:hypothetical protein
LRFERGVVAGHALAGGEQRRSRRRVVGGLVASAEQPSPSRTLRA